jgi:DNA polymerase I-like protein with 3'-5' exonuclease and polymerase domains
MFDRLRALALKHKVLSVDIETTGKDINTCDILLIAMCAGGNVKASLSMAVAPTKEAKAFLAEMCRNPIMRIVGHNILKYDMPVLYRHKVLVKDQVKAMVLDTLPMVWLMNENVSHRLKDSVFKYFEHKMVEYEDAYLTSPALLNIKANDKRIAELAKFLEKTLPVEARKLASAAKKQTYEEAVAAAEAGGWLTAEGVKITKKRLQAEAKLAAEERRKEHTSATTAHTEEEIETLKHDNDRLITQAQTEQRAYAQDDARQTLRLYKRCSREIDKLGLIRWARIENSVRRISADMEANGIAINEKILTDLDAVVAPLVDEFEAEIYNLAKKEFDINSPQQLSEVIYQDLEVPTVGGIRVDKNGKETDETYSTKENILARLAHPIGQAVLNYRTTIKLRTAFITKLTAMLRKAPDGRIHPSFNTTVRTGRWSCKNPNAQQIPSRKKAEVYDPRIQKLGAGLRAAFIAPPGMKMIIADLSQIELRLIAHFTGDPVLLEIYNAATTYDNMQFYVGDIHEKTANALGIDRAVAKNVNFGLAYGLSATGFAIRFKIFKPGTKQIDVDKTTFFRNGFLDLYGGLPEYLQRIQRSREGSFVKETFYTISGRARHFPKQEEAFPGKILNSIIQGSAADILKANIWAIDKYVLRNEQFKGTQLVLQVHDEVVLYAPEAIVEDVARLVKYTMELPWFYTDVPIFSSVKVTDNWAQKEDKTIPEVGIIPPAGTGIKPCVAMLTPEQRAWASHIVTADNFSPETKEDE